jgi:hypothetical protein
VVYKCTLTAFSVTAPTSLVYYLNSGNLSFAITDLQTPACNYAIDTLASSVTKTKSGTIVSTPWLALSQDFKTGTILSSSHLDIGNYQISF